MSDEESKQSNQEEGSSDSLRSTNAVANQLANKADWALEDGDHEEARRLFQQALDLDPTYKYARFGLAQAHVEGDDPDAALPLLQALIDEFPDEYEFQNELGLALMDLKRTEDAIEIFEGLIKEDPSYPAPYANLGHLWDEQGEPNKAIASFETYLEWSDDPEESEEIEIRIEELQSHIRRQERREQRQQRRS